MYRKLDKRKVNPTTNPFGNLPPMQILLLPGNCFFTPKVIFFHIKAFRKRSPERLGHPAGKRKDFRLTDIASAARQ